MYVCICILYTYMVIVAIERKLARVGTHDH